MLIYVACLSINLSIYLAAFIHLSIHPSIQLNNVKNETILRDFLNFWNLTTSKTTQFCETSAIFEVDNIKNEAILRDVLEKWKVECRADGLVPMRFAIFPLHLSKVLRLSRTSDARSYEVLHLSHKIISANLKI